MTFVKQYFSNKRGMVYSSKSVEQRYQINEKKKKKLHVISIPTVLLSLSSAQVEIGTFIIKTTNNCRINI